MLVHRAGPAAAKRAAVLLGWTGGKLKHVRRHERIWHDLDVRTVTAAQSIDDTFFPPAWTRLEATADAALDAVGGGPVIAHAFSNGGVLLLLKMLERAPGLDVAGLVVDSAPSPPGVVRPAAAPVVILSAGLGAAEAARTLARHAPYALAAEALRPLRGTPPPLDALATFADVGTTCPELYLFSEGDGLVPPRGIRAHAAERAARGVDVALREFDDSPHCGHYRAHPVDYARAVADFVGRLDGG